METRIEQFSAQKMICVVRNPFDVIAESADAKNLFNCNDRLAIEAESKKTEEYTDWWLKWVSNQATNMAECHKYVIGTVSDKVPILFIRYEDLVSEPTSCLTDVFKFVLDTTTLEDTIVARRIQDVVGSFAMPEPNTDGDLSEIFTVEQAKLIAEEMQAYNDCFKYAGPAVGSSQSHNYHTTVMSTAVNGEDDAIIQKSESTQAPFLKMNEAIFERSQTELLSSARTT